MNEKVSVWDQDDENGSSSSDVMQPASKGKERAPRDQASDWDQSLDAMDSRRETHRPSSRQMASSSRNVGEYMAHRPAAMGDRSAANASESRPVAKKGLLERFINKAWLWAPGAGEVAEDVSNSEEQQENEQRWQWEWQRHLQKKKRLGEADHSYNLYRQWYYEPEADKHEDTHWWILRSGLPFPSYHSNPTRNFPSRAFRMDGSQALCEELRAPRIRLAPQELLQRKYFLSAIQQKSEEVAEPKAIEALNLSYQNLGEEYQFEQLQAFLKINAGVRVLALTDNFLTDLMGITLPHLQELYLARNNIQTFQDIPRFPELRRLSVEENFITNLNGLNSEKFPKLVNLTLKLNPISNDPLYRSKVKAAMPALRQLDGVWLPP